MKNYILQYHDAVFDNKLIVCSAIEKQIELEKIKLQKYGYNDKYVEYAIKWIETYCRLVTGVKRGERIKLTLVQKWIIAGIFGFWGSIKVEQFDEDGAFIGYEERYMRLSREVLIMVASGFGKTTFAAAIAAFLLFAPKAMNDPQIFIGSNAHKQSRLCFDTIKGMIEQSKQLLSRTRIRDTFSEILVPSNGGKVRAMSSDGKNHEGIIPGVIILDEIHAMKTGDYAESFKKSSKRDDLLIIEITTQGTIRQGYLDQRLEYCRNVLNQEIEDDRTVAYIFEQESIEEITNAIEKNDVKIFMKSNPNIGQSTSVTILRNIANKIINDPSTRPQLLTKNFNIPQNPGSIYFSENECRLNSYKENILYGTAGFLGFDRAYTRTPKSDFCALTYLYYDAATDNEFYKDIVFLPKYYLDENQNKCNMISEKSKYDGIDYQKIISMGDHIVLIDDIDVSEKFIVDFIVEFIKINKLHILKFGVDPNKADFIKRHFNMMAQDDKFCVRFLSEAKSQNTPVIEDTKSKRALGKIFTNNPLTEIHFANVKAKQDDNGYIIFASHDYRRRKDIVISHLAAKSAARVFIAVNGKERLEAINNNRKYLRKG